MRTNHLRFGYVRSYRRVSNPIQNNEPEQARSPRFSIIILRMKTAKKNVNFYLLDCDFN